MKVGDQQALDDVYAKKHDLHALVDQLAKPNIDSHLDDGIVVTVLDENGQKHTFGYGKKLPNSDAPPDGDTIFAIGSLTKGFTTHLLYDLVKDGTFKYSDTVGDILPNEDFSQAAKRITLEQLANHTSGLPRQPMSLAMMKNVIHYSFTGDNIYSHMDKEEIYNYLKTFDPNPDSVGKYVYSNMGAALLGQLIEAKTKKSLAVLMDEHFFRPLKMKDTSYVVAEEKLPRLAQGHVGDSPYFVARNTPIPTWQTWESVRGMAGLYSTSNDLLKYLKYRMRLGDFPIVTVPMPGDADEYHFISVGWSVDKFDNGKTEIMFRHGLIAGYAAYMGFEPKSKVAVVILYNTFNWDDSIGHNLLLTMARNAKKHSIVKSQ